MAPEINDKLDRLTEQLAAVREELHTFLASQRATCEAHRRETADLARATWGNGRPGLATLVDRHDRAITAISRLTWIAVGEGLGALAAVVVYLVVH